MGVILNGLWEVGWSNTRVPPVLKTENINEYIELVDLFTEHVLSKSHICKISYLTFLTIILLGRLGSHLEETSYSEFRLDVLSVLISEKPDQLLFYLIFNLLVYCWLGCIWSISMRIHEVYYLSDLCLYFVRTNN